MPAVICRPLCGLNDQLNQIAICWNFAIDKQRDLFVDGTFGGLRDEFGVYFELASSQINVDLFGSRRCTSLQTPLSIWPHACSGVLPRHVDVRRVEIDGRVYQRRFIPGSHVAPDVRLCDDDCVEFVLHQQCGGGSQGITVLQRLRLTAPLAELVTNSLIGLPTEYDAVHVRHSDITSDFKSILGRYKGATLDLPLLISTDSQEVLGWAKEHLPSGCVLSVSNIPDTGGRRLHGNVRLPVFETNVAMLTDLLAMAGARELTLTRTQQGKVSGFGHLARQLMDEPAIRNQLLRNN